MHYTLHLQSPPLTCSNVQAYLKFAGIRFLTISSTNHASPTGVLPFLIPALTSKTNVRELPIPAAKLQRWALTETSRNSKKRPTLKDFSHAKKDAVVEEGDSKFEAREKTFQHAEPKERTFGLEEPRDMRYDAYLSLLDNRIRNAWVFGPIALDSWTNFRVLTESISYTFST